jgi:hypothetical protein
VSGDPAERGGYGALAGARRQRRMRAPPVFKNLKEEESQDPLRGDLRTFSGLPTADPAATRGKGEISHARSPSQQNSANPAIKVLGRPATAAYSEVGDIA